MNSHYQIIISSFVDKQATIEGRTVSSLACEVGLMILAPISHSDFWTESYPLYFMEYDGLILHYIRIHEL